MTIDYVVVEAPSILGLSPTGVERLPEALKAHGLVERLGARQGARLEPAEYSRERDPETGFLNPRGVRDFAIALAGALDPEWTRGATPVVLGGDCSILIGPMLGLRRRGRYGLLFIDGHADYYAPHQSPTGEVADMDLAVVTGASDDYLADIDGMKPLVRPEDTVLFGFRDEEVARQYGSQDVRTSGITAHSLSDIRSIGWEKAAESALAHVTRAELDGFFVHFDVDVLDDRVMPAVDYRMEDGLSYPDATNILGRARESGRMVGTTVTIFNPSLDADGSIGRRLADCLASGLGSWGPADGASEKSRRDGRRQQRG